MNFLFDTNIILYVSRNQKGLDFLHYLNPTNKLVYASFVSVAEVQSIVYQNKWGFEKTQRLESFLETLRIIDISDILMPTYIGIDAFSQRNHPDYEQYPFKTPRNMGKNDLWIAATSSLLNLKLLTTDADFDHLEDTFLSLQKISTDEINAIFKNKSK